MKAKYRVRINRVEEWETYVEADDYVSAVREGTNKIRNGYGQLLDEYFDDSTADANLSTHYVCTRDVTYTFRHACDAVCRADALEQAKKQFEKDYAGMDWVAERMGDFNVQVKEPQYSDFCDDREKMRDFLCMSKKAFLDSYSYLTEAEYDLTRKKYEALRDQEEQQNA